MKTALFIIVGFLIFVFGLWFVAIPESLIIGLIETSIGKDEFYIKAERLNKGLFYNLTIDTVLLKRKGSDKDNGNTLLSFSDIRAGIDIISLLRLNPELKFHCVLNGGRVGGTAGIIGKEMSIRVNGSNISMGGIGLFEYYGIRGDGRLSGGLNYSKGSGEMRFDADEARLSNTSIGGAYLPLSLFHKIRGALMISGETINVESFTLEGNGVHARLKGKLNNGIMDMNLELMMDASFKPDTLLHMMLEQYKVSPGYYVIRLKDKAG